MLITVCTVYLFSLLKCNAFEYTEENFDNITSTKFNSSITLKPVTETRIWKGNDSFNSDYGCWRDNCLWLQGSYCSIVTNKCVCFNNLIRVGNKCLQKRSVLGQSCSDSKQCLVDHSYCFQNKCACDHGYESSFGNLYCVKKIEKNIGETCNFQQGCVTPNSDCIGGRCRCKAGFEKYGYRCEIIYDKSSKRLGVTDIILISLSALVTFVVIMILVAIYKKRRRSVVESSTTQNSTVYIPPENIINFPEMNTPVYPIYENSGFNATYYRSEPTVNNLDKPPSYEEVMRSSRSAANLVNNGVTQELLYTNCATTMTTARTDSSSIR